MKIFFIFSRSLFRYFHHFAHNYPKNTEFFSKLDDDIKVEFQKGLDFDINLKKRV